MDLEAPAVAAAPDASPDGAPVVAGEKLNLIGQSREDLAALMTELGEKPFRAGQLWHWIYHRGETDFAAMSTLAKTFRAKLAERCVVSRPQAAQSLLSVDGSRKWLLSMGDRNQVEMVFIPEDDRGTLCVSSQVGCTLTCRFCHTGTQKLVRNLTAEELVGQVMLARDALGEWPSPSDGRLLSNIVLMGMGEPLYNFENVKKAMKIVMDGEGISLSRRRITLSTSGVVPMMHRVGAELDVNLAISLHACTDEVRDVLVPINRKYPLKELLAACRAYPGLSNSRRITFAYTMLKGVNDSPADARALIKLLEGIPAKVNLIPFNPWPGAPYECASAKAIQIFGDMINDAGYASPVRQPRGRDIFAACGQLKSESQRLRKSQLAAAPSGLEAGAALVPDVAPPADLAASAGAAA